MSPRHCAWRIILRRGREVLRADLAAATHSDAYVLQKLLEHLVGKGVLETAGARPALRSTKRPEACLSRGLTSAWIWKQAASMANAWSTMLAYVRTGSAAYEQVFGLPFWEDLAADPHLAASFDDLIGPGGHGTPDARLELADGWDGVAHVVDVGGGTGAMLAGCAPSTAIARYAAGSARTVARSPEIFEAAGVAARTRRAELFRAAAARSGCVCYAVS